MRKLWLGILICLAVVGFSQYLTPQSFVVVTPISAAASSTVSVPYSQMHTVLFFDIVTTSAATVTIVGNYKPYNIVWTAAASKTTFLFIHPLETVFYAKNEYITITKEGTFTTFNIYVLETYW